MIQRKKYSNLFGNGSLDYRDSVIPNEKDFLDRCKYYYGGYASDAWAIGFNGATQSGRSYDELRQYGRSMQSSLKYRNILDPKRYNKRKGKSYRRWNISWDINRILSKYRNQFKDRYTSLNLDIITQAIDGKSIKEKDLLVGKMKMMADPRTKEAVGATGFVLPDMQMVEGFDSPGDVDVYKQMGGIMLGIEILMKDVVDSTFTESKWDQLKMMLVEDWADLHAWATHVYLEKSSGRLKIEYVDPQRFFVRKSVHPDHHDSDFWSFIRTKNMAELRMELEESEIPDVEAAIENVSRTYRSEFNSHTGRRGFDRSNDNIGTLRSGKRYNNDMEADVMTLYFVDRVINRYASGHRKRGNRVFDMVNPDSSARNRDMVDIPVHNLYKCKWVVGTDIVYDYGLADIIVRKGENGSKYVIPPVVCSISQEPSIVEQCIGFVDDINIATFKIRKLISTLPPGPRMIVDQSALQQSVKVGDDEFTFLDSARNYRQDGILMISTKDEWGLPGQNDFSRKRPIDFLPAGIAEDIAIMRGEIQQNIQNIQNVTGFNPVTDGTSPDPDMLKHVAQGAVGATNSALAPDIRMFVDGVGNIAKSIGSIWKILVLSGEIEIKRSGVPYKVDKEIFNRDWLIDIKVDTTQTKEMLMQVLMSKREMIDDSVFFVIFNLLQQGDYKKVQLLMAKHSARQKEIEHQRLLEVQKVQADSNAQAAVAGEQAREKSMMSEYSNKENLTLLTHRLDLEKMKEQWGYREKEILLEKSLEPPLQKTQ